MQNPLRLMCVTAHPDDESLGAGPALARYAAEGVMISVLCATRGERGWVGDPQAYPGLEPLGKIRESELRAAARILGASEVHHLDYIDGELDQADPVRAISEIARHFRRFKPHVVLTFDPFGAYGHPDHIAICQWTTAAVVVAANPKQNIAGDSDPMQTHVVSKLYYLAETREMIDRYEAVVGEVTMLVNGARRHNIGWPDCGVTTEIDASGYWRTVWEAIQCHVSQKHEYEGFKQAPESALLPLLGRRTFYRATSLVNGGSRIEMDLFEGLRE